MRLKQKRTVATFASIIAVGLFFIFTINSKAFSLWKQGMYRDIPTYLFEPLEPEVISDFPSNPNMNATIPKIIHQIWNDFIIPTQYIQNIRSIVNNHHGWTYFFWTLELGRVFIRDHFPEILPIYDAYTVPVDKSDLLRYVVLYKYGGVFLDLDTYSLRPLDLVIASYPCVLVREPPEHVALLYSIEFYLANGVLFTRPKHPFIDYILKYVHTFKHFESPSGTRVFTTLYLMYKTSDGSGHDVPDNSIYISPSQYFLPSIDPSNHKHFKKLCSNFERLNLIMKRGCSSYIERYVKSSDPVTEFAFNMHIWGHSQKLDFDKTNHVKSIVPNVKIYNHSDTKFKI